MKLPQEKGKGKTSCVKTRKWDDPLNHSQDSHEWEEEIFSEASKNVKCENGGGQKNLTVGKIKVGINT